jgi:tetratricopeptide (TPR) repeat protein
MLTAVLICLCFLAEADAVRLYRQRQFAAAESEFRRLLAIRPRNAQIRLYLARTLVELNRVPEALAEIERALGTQSDPETQFQAGRIVRELAERRFADLDRLAPDSAAVHELGGRQLEREGNLPEALREYRAAIVKEPGRPGLNFAIGNILWRMRELDGAVKELEAELARTPRHGMANLRLGQVFLARNQAAEAAPFLEQAVDAMPESTDARRELGKAYRSLGRTAEAREQWEAVAKARPDDDQVHYLLGNLYRQLGDGDRAQRELNQHRAILERRRKRD